MGIFKRAAAKIDQIILEELGPEPTPTEYLTESSAKVAGQVPECAGPAAH